MLLSFNVIFVNDRNWRMFCRAVYLLVEIACKYSPLGCFHCFEPPHQFLVQREDSVYAHRDTFSL